MAGERQAGAEVLRSSDPDGLRRGRLWGVVGVFGDSEAVARFSDWVAGR